MRASSSRPPSFIGVPLEDLSAPVESSQESKRRRRRIDWREGGRSVRRWNATVLTVVLISAGTGLVLSGVLGRLGSFWSAMAAPACLWAGMAVGVAFAFSRSRPLGLLRARSMDLLWGLAFGLALRGIQGWLSGAGAQSFPTISDGVINPTAWIAEAFALGLVAPVLEEFTFRAVLLVCVYQLLRRSVGRLAAGVTSGLVSASAFVLMHGSSGSLMLADGIQIFLVGACCAGIVFLTGRIWGAVLTHIVYNVTYLLLALVGTLLR